MTSETTLLDRVRKLLAKAEAEGVTPHEAEALTAKAAELMARYGIDRAMLAATRPETDQPGNRIIDIANPWAQVRAHLLAGLAGAMRCQCILLSPRRPRRPRAHVRVPFRPETDRHLVHLAAAPDGARPDRRGPARRSPQPASAAAKLAARVRRRCHRPGQVGRGPGRRQGRSREHQQTEHRAGTGRPFGRGPATDRGGLPAPLSAGKLPARSHRSGLRAEGFAGQQAGHGDLLTGGPRSAPAGRRRPRRR